MENNTLEFKYQCDELRETAINLLNKSLNSDSVEDSFALLFSKASALFLSLKELDRSSHHYTKNIKLSTAEGKQSLDKAQLALQNLLYESLHIKREIEKCDEFESIYQDIELIDTEEFLNDHPEESRFATSDIHSLMLKRLQYESLERTRLTNEELELIVIKDKLLQENKSIRSELDNWDGQLDTILKSTKPLQNEMGVKITSERDGAKLASQLPIPLFVLFEMAWGFAKTYPNSMNVEIEENEVEMAAATAALSIINLKDREITKTETDDIEMSDYFDPLQRKESDVDFYVKHPLSVIVSLNCGSQETKISDMLKFKISFHPYVDFVTINQMKKSIPIEWIGCNLFGDDDGLDFPNASTSLLVGTTFNRKLVGDAAVYFSKVLERIRNRWLYVSKIYEEMNDLSTAENFNLESYQRIGDVKLVE
ncbi:hypothetical protein HK096_002813, partial [Nowakowskiella sp. JEL0078]